VTTGALNDCGGHRKVPTMSRHKYFLHLLPKKLGANMMAPNSLLVLELTQAPSHLIMPLQSDSD